MRCCCRMLERVLAQAPARSTLGAPSNRQGIHASGRQPQAEVSGGDSSHGDDESHPGDRSGSDSSGCSGSEGSGDEAGALKVHLLIGHLLLMTTSGAAAGGGGGGEQQACKARGHSKPCGVSRQTSHHSLLLCWPECGLLEDRNQTNSWGLSCCSHRDEGPTNALKL